MSSQKSGLIRLWRGGAYTWVCSCSQSEICKFVASTMLAGYTIPRITVTLPISSNQTRSYCLLFVFQIKTIAKQIYARFIQCRSKLMHHGNYAITHIPKDRPFLINMKTPTSSRSMWAGMKIPKIPMSYRFPFSNENILLLQS